VNLIDPKIVATQILGFLVLVWAMRKWAFGPLMAVLETRRQAIAAEFQAAERTKAEAAEAKARFEQEMRGIEAQARQRLQESVAEGQKVAAEIRAQAQQEAADRIERAGDEIAREREKAKELVKEQVIRLSMRSAEKILRQKLDDPTHRAMVGQFVDEVEALR
jgi:F-type H+-transporting ATPase subunit b